MTNSLSNGFTLLETLVVLGLIGVMLGIVRFNFKGLETPAATAASEMTGHLKKVRAKALSSTKAYTILPGSSTTLVTRSGKNCHTAQQQNENNLTYTLPRHSWMTSTNWSLCYNSRGVADTSVDIPISDSKHSKKVQAVMGGGVRVQ